MDNSNLEVFATILIVFLLDRLLLTRSTIIPLNSQYSGSVLRVLSLFERCNFLLILHNNGRDSNREILSFLQSGQIPRILDNNEEVGPLQKPNLKPSSPTKHSKCHSIFIDLSWIEHYSSIRSSMEHWRVEISLIRTMNTIVLQKLNPSYIFLEYVSVQSDGACVRHDLLTGRIAQLLPHLTVTSDFLAILVSRRKTGSNYSPTSIIVGFCLSCTYEVEIPPLISHLDELSAWFRTLRDMNGLYVQSRFPVLPFYKCGLYQKTEPAALAPEYWNLLAKEYYSIHLGKLWMLVQFVQFSSIHFFYINYAALLLPFDIFTWILVFTGGIFVNILVYKITPSTKGYLLVWSLITAMEQPILTKRESSTGKLLILCGTWLTSIYILGSLYKGDMVSVLTSRTTRQVPDTLKDLVTSNITILTTDHYDNLNGPPPISRCSLHDLVIPQLMNAINSKYTLYHVLTRLRLGSKCVKIFNVYEISKNISNYGLLRTNSEKEFIIPDQFAVIDPTNMLTSIQTTILLFPTYLPITNLEIPFYTELKPWIVSANFFGPRFISGLASLVESGIHGWWSNNANEVSLLIDIEAVKGVGNVGEEFAKVSFAKEMRTKHGIMTAVAISFDKLRIPFVICLFCLGIGVVFLCKELIYFHFKKRTSKVTLKGVANRVMIVRSMRNVPLITYTLRSAELK
ncbi:hypothetical protein Fcan01_25428 [Folsomia candida]|uniref:Uncharacterized protein n=1 Tax=Folsomia candida TaxID=158441 RepID=A0A226D4Q9_FOLCA|nr:hypothetical protein Fcan01_25428 [Folsomia candida]